MAKKRSYVHYADGSTPDSPESFTTYCRQRLGVTVPVGNDRTRWYAQLKSEMEIHNWSWEDVAEAVHYCQRKGIKIRYPYGVLHFVDEALEDRQHQEIDNLHAKVAEALGKETDEVWVRRLSLAQGKALERVYENWRKERG